MCSCVCDLQVLNTIRLEVLGVLLEDLQKILRKLRELLKNICKNMFPSIPKFSEIAVDSEKRFEFEF